MRSNDFFSLLTPIDVNRALDIERYSSAKLSASQLRKFARKTYSEIIRYEIHWPDCNFDSTLDVLFFKSLSRPDYDELFYSVMASLPHLRVDAVDCPLTRSAEIKPDRVTFVEECKPLLRVIEGRSRAEIIYLFLRLCVHLLIIDCVLRLHFKSLVVFADMQVPDYLLCRVCSRLGRKTATLQHGLYVEYAGLDNVNRVNYENHSADVFLAWGSVTADLIKKYHPDSDVVVVGRPPRKNSIPMLDMSDQIGFLVVILDQPLFDSQNAVLLERVRAVAKRLRMRVLIKPHPNTDLAKFNISSRESVVGERNWDGSFFVGHTSSLLYEMLCKGYPVARLRTEVPAIEIKKENTFSSESELLTIVSRAGDVADAEYAKRYIAHDGNSALEQYRIQISQLITTDGDG